MEVVNINVTNREFNFIIDVLRTCGEQRVRGNPQEYAYKQHEAVMAQDLADKLLRERREHARS